MKKMLMVVALAMLALLVLPCSAGVTNFDDVTTVVMAEIPDGYSGLNWDNFWVMNGEDYPNTSGYQVANTSGKYSAFNFNAGIAQVTSGSSFVLNSFQITAGWNVGMSVQIEGSLQGDVKYTRSFLISPYAPLLVTMVGDPDNQSIDRLVFTPSGGYSVFPGGSGTHFAIDDFTTEDIAAVPAPGALLLAVMGTGLVGWLRKRRTL